MIRSVLLFMSIRLHSIFCQTSIIAWLRLCVNCYAGISMFMNLLYIILLVVTNTRVQANGNNVIVLINRDTAC